MNHDANTSPRLGHPRIHRQVSFDVQTFDALQDAKRQLSVTEGFPLTNSGVLRMLVLSHPLHSAGAQGVSSGGN